VLGAERSCRHRNQKRGRAQKLAYPTLHLVWIENARRTRQGRPLIPVPAVDTPAANRMRALRQLRRRRADYERDRASGIIRDDTSNPAGWVNDPAQQRGRRPDTNIAVQYGNR